MLGNGSWFSWEKLLTLEHPACGISVLVSHPGFVLGILLWALKSFLKNLCQEQVSLTEPVVPNSTEEK